MSITIEDLFRVEGTILLLGETGSGKSYWARKIHENSKFKSKKFMNLNLATLSDELIVSELFGHVRGAFTGAHSFKRGLVEAVGEGTLFLDEVGELSLAAQKRLLMLLDEGVYSPVGSEEIKHFKGRMIAATNKNLKQMVERAEFREDLFYRLNVFSFFIRPIRENKHLLEEIINFYFNKYKKKFKGEDGLSLSIESECYETLLNYCWPGNIREIKNLMEYLTSLSRGDLIVKSDLPSYITEDKTIGIGEQCSKISSSSHSSSSSCESSADSKEEYPMEYCQALEKFERSYFSYVLDKFDGRINYTAEKIKISKVTLISKAKKYGINTMLLRAKIK
ncbi:MAG: sigma-54-dependent Fis family transcriptional regulator [Oligoflexia bacterium]|nr:sigma-54-dependent Fis family transcriptional regulator [Oligoflexia bacterium]